MVPRSTWFAALFIVAVFSWYAPEILEAQVPSPQGSSQTFSRITLEDATRLALEHNQSLRAQRLAVDQAKASEITAALKPNPVFTNLNEDFPLLSPNFLTLDNLQNNQEFTDSVTYTIERGGKRLKRVQVAQDTTDVTVKTVADNERQLKFQVAQGFIDALLARSNFEFAKEDLKDFLQVVGINQKRMEAGDISEADYLKIKLQQLQFEQDVSAAQVALVQGKAALRQLVGYDTVPEDFELVGDLKHTKYAPTLADLEKEALLSRPDYLAAQSSVKLANDTVTLAYGNRARDLTVESEYKRNGPVNGLGFGLSIEIPIHDRNQGEIARSKVAARQALESAESVRIGVLTDVRSAYAGYKTADEVASLYESGYLDQASQSREISNYAYQRGAASLLDLLDAERSYRATQLAYRQALAAYMSSTEQIHFVVGKKVMQ
jgi:cobalt-zinc-cadmium efflux system outer membrane protein